MPIRIECSNCGYQNDLGRVFCAQCGVKLDLQATSARELKAHRHVDVAGLVRRLVTAVLLLLVVGTLGLALWPEAIPGTEFDKSGPVQVPMKAKAVKAAISYKRAATLNLSEGELNGFLSERGRSRGLTHLVIDLKPGTFSLYAGRTWYPATNVTWLAWVKGSFSIGMQGSFSQGILHVEGARVGHLPLPALARAPVVNTFSSLFEDVLREQRVVTALKSVAIEETRAELVLGP